MSYTEYGAVDHLADLYRPLPGDPPDIDPAYRPGGEERHLRAVSHDGSGPDPDPGDDGLAATTHDTAQDAVSRSAGIIAAGQGTDTTLTTHTTPTPDVLSVIRTGADLDAYQPPPLRQVVAGLLITGLTLLVGAPKRGKSWLTLALALAVASGRRALGDGGPDSGLPVESGPVLLLALEDSQRRLQDRCYALLGPDESIPTDLHYATALARPRCLLETLRGWLAQHPDARLMIVDTLARVRPPTPAGQTQYHADHAVLAALHRVAHDHDVALVVVHHTRKAGADDWLDTVSGTQGLAGAADTIMGLDRPRGDNEGVLRVTGRDIAEDEHALRMVGGAWQLTGQPPVDPSLSTDMGRVLRAVYAHPGGATAAQIATATGLPTDRVRDYLARHVRADRARRAGRGIYAPPARAAADVS